MMKVKLQETSSEQWHITIREVQMEDEFRYTRNNSSKDGTIEGKKKQLKNRFDSSLYSIR